MAVNNLFVLLRFCVSFIIINSVIGVIGSNDKSDNIRALPYCDQTNKSSTQGQRELVIVSTLDGRVSALDASNRGLLEWSVSTGPGQLLSSNIHRLELTNNGHWVRMIPSLSGGLYKFNGENIEAIPITADSLLKSSSFLFSDDLVISGGKESRTYGVALKTGQVLYECSMKGCDNLNDNIHADEDLLVVQRKTQTIRAVEVRTGGERWNFSVGLHDLKLISDISNNCHQSNSKQEKLVSDLEFRVIVPEGLVCAVSKTGSREVIWKYKFDAPVVTAWHFSNGQMHDVDLFSGSQRVSENVADDVLPVSPALYIGMHQKQLYIQESVNMQHLIQNGLTDESPKFPRLPWVPVPVTSTALGLFGEDDSTSWSLEDAKTTTALSILYATEYVNGNGFYLFTESALKNQSQCNALNVTIESDNQHENDEDYDPDETPVQIIIVSLWHWWKEVLIISISTAIILNCVINRNLIPFIYHGAPREVIRKEIIVVEKHVPISQDPSPVSDLQLRVRSNSESNQMLVPEYTSRYMTDFEPVHCLGKGGFGVVFEAKNKIDDCHYAIKRIALPNKQESRDRVMREVKALAKLEHTNIVRYFNAWLECPPAGWEDEKHETCNSIGDGSSYFGNQDTHSKFNNSYATSPLTGDTRPNGFEYTINQRNDLLNLNTDFVDLPKKYCSDGTIDKSDSFIIFEAHEPQSKDEFGDYHENESDSVILNVTSSNSGIDKNNAFIRQHDQHSTARTSCRRPSSLAVSESVAVSLTPSPSRVYLFIQMQLCRKESLREWLRDNTDNRDTSQVLHIFGQIVQAVEYVHLQGLIHRDLKPSNIFFSPDGQIKVGDFGLVTAMVENEDEQRTPSKEMSSQSFHIHTAQVGTQLYMSPEQLHGMCYSYKVDIYSLGLILFELLVPFTTQMERGCILTDLRRNKFPSKFSQEFSREYELLRLMLSHNPEERPTTFGIRAKPPLCHNNNDKIIDDQWHFELPIRRDSSKSLSNSSSVDSSSWEQV